MVSHAFILTCLVFTLFGAYRLMQISSKDSSLQYPLISFSMAESWKKLLFTYGGVLSFSIKSLTGILPVCSSLYLFISSLKPYPDPSSSERVACVLYSVSMILSLSVPPVLPAQIPVRNIFDTSDHAFVWDTLTTLQSAFMTSSDKSVSDLMISYIRSRSFSAIVTARATASY